MERANQAMNRWKCKTKKYGDILIYADTLELAQKSLPEATEIEPYADMSYMQYINEIKSQSEFIRYDHRFNRNGEIYKYPHNGSYILVKMYTEKDEYYDFCEFQRWDCIGGIAPITWTMSEPAKFCNMFKNEDRNLPQGFVVTPRKIKKLKPTKFYNKNNQIYWVDSDGYFYLAYKYDMPNKHNKTEYERFKDNPNAVLIRFTSGIYSDNYSIRWFDNIDSFKEYFQDLYRDRNPSFGNLSYEIIKSGYNKKNPEDRKIILRLPYINIEAELALGTPTYVIALSWLKMCRGSWVSNSKYEYDWLEDIIIEYKKWLKEKNDVKK